MRETKSSSPCLQPRRWYTAAGKEIDEKKEGEQQEVTSEPSRWNRYRKYFRYAILGSLGAGVLYVVGALLYAPFYNSPYSIYFLGADAELETWVSDELAIPINLIIPKLLEAFWKLKAHQLGADFVDPFDPARDLMRDFPKSIIGPLCAAWVAIMQGDLETGQDLLERAAQVCTQFPLENEGLTFLLPAAFLVSSDGDEESADEDVETSLMVASSPTAAYVLNPRGNEHPLGLDLYEGEADDENDDDDDDDEAEYGDEDEDEHEGRNWASALSALSASAAFASSSSSLDPATLLAQAAEDALDLEDSNPRLWTVDLENYIPDLIADMPNLQSIDPPATPSIVKTNQGRIVIINPISFSHEIASAISALGEVEAIVMPTNSPTKDLVEGLADAAQQWPGAKVIGSSRHEHNPEYFPGVTFDGFLDDSEIFNEEFDVFPFRSHWSTDTWLQHRPSRSLHVTNSVRSTSTSSLTFCGKMYNLAMGLVRGSVYHESIGCENFHYGFTSIPAFGSSFINFYLNANSFWTPCLVRGGIVRGDWESERVPCEVFYDALRWVELSWFERNYLRFQYLRSIGILGHLPGLFRLALRLRASDLSEDVADVGLGDEEGPEPQPISSKI